MAMTDAGVLQGVPQLTNGQGHVVSEQGGDLDHDDVPMISININNVVCSYNTKCHLNLKRLAMEGTNVEYHRQHGMVNMKLRRPGATASIWSSGKITCTGSVSEENAHIAARKFARKIQKLGNKVKFCNYRVVNVLGTCSLPFAINIAEFSRKHKEASYEPELHPGVTYKIKEPKATLKIFSTGSITVTAPRVSNVQSAIEYIYPLVSDFNAGPAPVKVDNSVRVQPQPQYAHKTHRTVKVCDRDDYDSEFDTSDGDSDGFSDESQD